MSPADRPDRPAARSDHTAGQPHPPAGPPGQPPDGVHEHRTLDPIELQVILGALRAACEEMGATLTRSAHSPNIKERRDASTALFDRDGEMVMQAEHIPVHLGSMPAAVKAVLGREQSESVSWVLNDPFEGGTHLPDITVVTPVFAAAGAGADVCPETADSRAHANKKGLLVKRAFNARAREDPQKEQHQHPQPDPNEIHSRAPGDRPQILIGYAASRAHHADVGARVPGSMPADSTTLAEEGVVIPPHRLTDETLAKLVEQMRNPRERRADLKAQLAANRVGAQRLRALARRVGTERLEAAMAEVLDYAERRTKACIAALPDGDCHAEDVLEAAEGDLRLRLKATVEGERMVLDFSGSTGRHAGNLNCPLAVTLSACWFAVRVLTDPDIPPSAGAYRPVEVIVPEGTLLNAKPQSGEPAPAVAAGNVETSSRVADLVLKAFGRALGQGTMNNLTLGNEGFTYYETIGGGQGACPDADGPSGVHVAMSNTLNTPVEALERELPLRVGRYAIRRGSGGQGERKGGDGVVREVEALEPMTFSLIAERRRNRPAGTAGGEDGQAGRDALIAADGGERELQAKTMGTLQAGDRLRIETPGGGGNGPPKAAPMSPVADSEAALASPTPNPKAAPMSPGRTPDAAPRAHAGPPKPRR